MAQLRPILPLVALPLLAAALAAGPAPAAPTTDRWIRACDLACVEALVATPLAETRLHIEGDEGYPDCSSLSAEAARRLADLQAPNLRSLDLSLRGPVLAEVLAAPAFARLDSLTLCTDGAGLGSIGENLPALHSLTVRSPMAPLEPAAVTALLARPRLGHLRDLHLQGSDSEAETTLEAAGWEALAAADPPASLRHLDLSWTDPQRESAVLALLGAPWLGRLAVLDLGHTRLSPAIADALVARAPWPALVRLCVSARVGATDPAQVETLRAAYGARFDTGEVGCPHPPEG